ncbi:TetR family transcriptional regulator [Streptomyces albus]|uniref:TetR family transcriptional regulator n=1 Tax=Streptomyces albus (strain ATCC 21838 / DSM 41398 / FERM P-419 / JCM 4703 / NBRC 107858) TaxID=1081613 RepID=A0A0B5EM78_STRA4|nr:TetR family transcriptional regulator [Streptomyces albus]AOU74770.1 TetR family transcriptional regulator [Streptomyces albus]AYN30581.1 TetR family transcriptional regulator [Streptomyces albus]
MGGLGDGPPPLGPGAPAPERLLAFLEVLGGIAEGNTTLLSAHEQACADDKYGDPSYRFWHRHLSSLFADEHPDADADFMAHAVLAVFDGALIRRMTPPADPRRFTRSVQQMAMALLRG